MQDRFQRLALPYDSADQISVDNACYMQHALMQHVMTVLYAKLRLCYPMCICC